MRGVRLLTQREQLFKEGAKSIVCHLLHANGTTRFCNGTCAFACLM